MNLKALRESRGITQQQTADAAGINIRQYQKFESGERDIAQAQARVAVAVAKALGVTVEDLIRKDPGR